MSYRRQREEEEEEEEEEEDDGGREGSSAMHERMPSVAAPEVVIATPSVMRGILVHTSLTVDTLLISRQWRGVILDYYSVRMRWPLFQHAVVGGTSLLDVGMLAEELEVQSYVPFLYAMQGHDLERSAAFLEDGLPQRSQLHLDQLKEYIQLATVVEDEVFDFHDASFIPFEIGEFSNLRQMVIRGKKLLTLPKTMVQMTRLWNLKLTEVPGFRVFPLSMASMEQLSVLRVVKSNLKQWPINLERFVHLEELHLSHNLLSRIPASIKQMKNLVMLNLRHNRLSLLPPKLGALARLEILDVRNNRLRTLPSELGHLAALKKLELNSNLLRELPHQLSALAQLLVLGLADNQLSWLPDRLSRLHLLKTLNLRNNKFPTFPPAVLALSDLRGLQLGENKIHELPSDLGRLVALKSLLLYDNILVRLPAEISQLASLTSLDVDDNLLTGLPDTFSELGGTLVELSMNRNMLSEVPEVLEHMGALTRLLVARNDIGSFVIPPGAFLGLLQINLSNNGLVRLEGLELLPNLQHIDISFNPALRHLPNRWASIDHLQWVNISGTNIYLEPQSQLRQAVMANTLQMVAEEEAFLGQPPPERVPGWHTVTRRYLKRPISKGVCAT